MASMDSSMLEFIFQEYDRITKGSSSADSNSKKPIICCSHCNTSYIVEDVVNDDAVCADCGLVLYSGFACTPAAGGERGGSGIVKNVARTICTRGIGLHYAGNMYYRQFYFKERWAARCANDPRVPVWFLAEQQRLGEHIVGPDFIERIRRAIATRNIGWIMHTIKSLCKIIHAFYGVTHAPREWSERWWQCALRLSGMPDSTLRPSSQLSAWIVQHMEIYTAIVKTYLQYDMQGITRTAPNYNYAILQCIKIYDKIHGTNEFDENILFFPLLRTEERFIKNESLYKVILERMRQECVNTIREKRPDILYEVENYHFEPLHNKVFA